MVIYEDLLNLKEYKSVLGQNELKSSPVSEKLAKALIDKIIEYIKLRVIKNKEKEYEEFNMELSYLINYQELLLDKVSLLIDNKVINKEDFINLIKDFIYRGTSKWEVILGLMLCKDYLKDYEIDHIVNVFSKSGEYIFYLKDCIKDMENSEEFLFNLCKKTDGTIRVFAIINMNFSKDEEVKYLINEGYKNKQYTNLLVNYIVENNIMWKYLKKDDLNFRDIKNISYIVVEYIKDKDLESLPCIIDLIKLYLPYAIIEGTDIYSIYAVFLLDTVISHKRLEFIKDREFLLNIINDKLKRCEYLFREAIKKVQGKVKYVIELGEYYKYKFSFKELKPYLKTKKDGYFIYYYFKKFKFILEIEDCRRYFAENPEFKEILEYFNDLGGSYKLSKNEDFIRKFDLELKKRNPISL